MRGTRFYLIFLFLIQLGVSGYYFWKNTKDPKLDYIVSAISALSIAIATAILLSFRLEGFRVQAPISTLSDKLTWGEPYPIPLYQH